MLNEINETYNTTIFIYKLIINHSYDTSRVHPTMGFVIRMEPHEYEFLEKIMLGVS